MKSLSPALKNMTLYGSSIVLMKGVSLFMLPYIANHISQHELGRLELLSTFAMVLSVVLGLSLHEALYRYAGSEQDKNKKRKITAEIFTLTMLVALISLPIIWLISPFIAHMKPEYATTLELELILMSLSFEGVVAVVLASLRMREKAILFFWVTTTRALLQALLTVWVLSLGYGVTAILSVGFFAATLQIITLIYIQVEQNKKVGDTLSFYNHTMTKNSLAYSLPLMASGLIAFGLNGFERWVLAESISFQHVALYAVALKFSLALTLLMQPFCMWWMPKRFEYLASKGAIHTVNITQSSLVLLCAITVLVSYLAPVLIDVLMPESYHSAKHIAVALIVIAALKEANELLNLGALAKNQTKRLLSINSVITTLGMIAILIFVPMYGMTILLFILGSAQFLRMMATYRLSQTYRPLPYASMKIYVLFLLTLTTSLFATWQQPLFTHLSVGAASLCVVLVIAYLFDFINHSHLTLLKESKS